MKLAPNTQTLLAGAAVVFLAAWYLQSRLSNGIKKTGEVLVDIAPYVNPLDSKNFIYGGISNVGEAITGNDWSLGTGIYDAEQSIKNWWKTF